MEAKKGALSNPVGSDDDTEPLASDLELTSDDEWSAESDAELDPEPVLESKGASTSASLIGSSSSSNTITLDSTILSPLPQTSGSSTAILPGTPTQEPHLEQLLSMGNMPTTIVAYGSSGQRLTLRSPLSLPIMQQLLGQTPPSTGSSE